MSLVAAMLAGCDGGAAAPQAAPMPEELVAYVDQNRLLRVGRQFSVSLVHEGDGTVTVTRAELVSERFGTLTWTGEKTFMNGAGLDLELPPASCGRGSDVRLTLTYRLDDGPLRTSTTTAADRYGALGLLMDNDCAERTLAEAASLEVGEPEVVGRGRRSVFRLPVSLVATGARPEVSFEGFDSTVLFRVVRPRRLYPRARPVAMTAGTAYTVDLTVVPSRCDPHALAEDKVGTLLPVHVAAPGLPRHASFHLPLSDSARAELRGFFGPHCGL